MTNKKIRSKIAITYHPTVKTTASSILTGKILGVARPRFDYIAVKYEYRDAADVVIESGAWTMEGEAQIDALMALGYSLGQAREALRLVDVSIKDSGERIREALKKMGK